MPLAFFFLKNPGYSHAFERECPALNRSIDTLVTYETSCRARAQYLYGDIRVPNLNRAADGEESLVYFRNAFPAHDPIGISHVRHDDIRVV